MSISGNAKGLSLLAHGVGYHSPCLSVPLSIFVSTLLLRGIEFLHSLVSLPLQRCEVKEDKDFHSASQKPSIYMPFRICTSFWDWCWYLWAACYIMSLKLYFLISRDSLHSWSLLPCGRQLHHYVLCNVIDDCIAAMWVILELRPLIVCEIESTLFWMLSSIFSVQLQWRLIINYSSKFICYKE